MIFLKDLPPLLKVAIAQIGPAFDDGAGGLSPGVRIDDVNLFQEMLLFALWGNCKGPGQAKGRIVVFCLLGILVLRLDMKQRLRNRRALLFGLLCIALVFIGGTLQVSHTHALENLAHPDCAVCVVAHAGISPTVLVTLPAPVHYATRIEIAPSAREPRSFFTLTLHIRPPPVDPAVA